MVSIGIVWLFSRVTDSLSLENEATKEMAPVTRLAMIIQSWTPGECIGVFVCIFECVRVCVCVCVCVCV